MPVHTSPQLRVPIDPRIRQRRIQVQRDQGRRRLRALGACVAAAAVAVAGWGALYSPLLDVDRIRISGAERTPPAEVLAAAGVTRGQPLARIPEAAAAARIEGVPWVAEASVRRRWPGTVEIRVQERRAGAAVRSAGGTWAVLDLSGRVLENRAERPPGLVEVAAAVGEAPVLRQGDTAGFLVPALEVLGALGGPLAERTAAVTVVEGGGIALKLNPRGTVVLGPPGNVAAKLRAAETVLASVDAPNLAVLDVRVPSSPVLTRG